MSTCIFSRAFSARSLDSSICSGVTGLVPAAVSLPAADAFTQLRNVCSTRPSSLAATTMPTPWACLTACSLNSAVYSCFGIFFTSLPSGLDANHRPLEDEKRRAAQTTCSSTSSDTRFAATTWTTTTTAHSPGWALSCPCWPWSSRRCSSSEAEAHARGHAQVIHIDRPWRCRALVDMRAGADQDREPQPDEDPPVGRRLLWRLGLCGRLHEPASGCSAARRRRRHLSAPVR